MKHSGAGEGWQCVLICWGSRYDVRDINRLVTRIRTEAATPPRMVLITDRDRPGLDPEVLVRPFPPFFLQEPWTRAGCQAKLAMFEAGVLPDDLPAVYVDLDTVVTGDLGAGVAMMRDPRSILMLQSALLPFGALGRLVHRLTGGRRYARGNSSVVVFHPAECAFIAARFREIASKNAPLAFRPTIADERFISWVAQDHMIALPRSYATKLSAEFMSRLPALLSLRARLPWVRRRRATLAAITLAGPEVKAEVLLALPDEARVRDRKGRHLIWSDAAMGAARARIVAHYADAG